MAGRIEAQQDKAVIEVPGSTANLGLYFDKAGAALSRLLLRVTLEPTTGRGIEVQAASTAPTPKGRQRGYAGVRALEQYAHQLGVTQGLKLTYEDISSEGFPTGGTGLSGAESVGAIVAAAVLFDQAPSEREVILASAKGEPGEHKDNVAPSALGGIVFLSDTPHSGETQFHRVVPPKDLGLAIGFSSHQKIQGTEGTRAVLTPPVLSEVFVNQVGRGVLGALGLQAGDVEEFLHMVSGDGYHEPRRADAGMYGNFSANEFSGLKRELNNEHGIALAVSGAGPNMQFWFDRRRYPQGISEKVTDSISLWFENYGINLRVEEVPIAEKGAYAFAQQKYPHSALASRA